jgi:hypothetical protein
MLCDACLLRDQFVFSLSLVLYAELCTHHNNYLVLDGLCFWRATIERGAREKQVFFWRGGGEYKGKIGKVAQHAVCCYTVQFSSLTTDRLTGMQRGRAAQTPTPELFIFQAGNEKRDSKAHITWRIIYYSKQKLAIRGKLIYLGVNLKDILSFYMYHCTIEKMPRVKSSWRFFLVTTINK